jgi:hypothetical protein
LFLPACYVGREGIAELTTDKIEELIHASSHIDDILNFVCTYYNSFFDDTFDFTCAFTSTTPPPPPRALETTPPTPHAAAKLSSSSTTSTGRTSDIKCHRCHGVGHFQCDCPSKKSYITTDDGGYVSASDIEDDFALQTNNADDLNDDDADVFGSEHAEEYSTKIYVVQWVLSAQVDTSEKLQCHNLFHIFFIVKDCLTTRLHTHSYYI